MLSKLIKYEFKATARKMLPLMAAVVALAALSGVSVMMLDKAEDYGFLTAVFVATLMAFFVCIFAVCVMAFVVMIQRFYNNLLGSEGYMMFTLQVSVDALVWAKLIVSFVWFLATAVTCVLAMIVLMTVSANFAFTGEELRYVMQGVKDILNNVGAGNIIGYILELAAALFLASVSTCLHFYLAMAIGQCFANRRGMWSVLAFFAIAIVVSVLTGFVLGVINRTGIDPIDTGSMLTAAHIVFLGNIVSSAALSAIFYFPTTMLLKKHLNLA